MQLFANTMAICCDNFPLWSAMKESHPCTDTCLSAPPTLCVSMRAISFHAWIGLSAPSAKQCGGCLSGRDVAGDLAVSCRPGSRGNAPLLPVQTSICVITARYKWIHAVTPWCLEHSRAKWPVDKFFVSEETTDTFHGQCSTAALWCHLGCVWSV